MPKRSAEEKLAHYERKIKKLQETVKKKQLYNNDDIGSDNEEIEIEPYTDMVDELLHQPVETLEDQTINEPQLALPPSQLPSPPSQPPLPASTPVIEQEKTGEVQVTGGPSTEAPSDPPLDPELLSALGACTSDTPDFGQSIHSSLANIWPPILRKGLTKEDKETLMKEYLIPTNCKLLQAPKLNAEISAAVSDVVRGRDKKLTGFQQELGAGMAAINRGMDTMLKRNDKALALKNFSDGCRLLSDLHFCFTKDRTKLMVPSLEKSFLNVIQDSERDDTLFGSSLADKIKACKAIERQGHQIRNKSNMKNIAPQAQAQMNSRPVHQGNWTGPPRYPSNRGGRGGRGRAAATASRRPYPTTTTQTVPRGSNQSKYRANTQR